MPAEQALQGRIRMKTVGRIVVVVAACMIPSLGFSADAPQGPRTATAGSSVGATQASEPANGSGETYTASALLRISPAEPTILGSTASPFSEREYTIYKKTQQFLVRSRQVLSAAIRTPDVAMLPSAKAEQFHGDRVRWLEKIITVTLPDDTELMVVSATTNNPKESATLARAVVNAYLVEMVNLERNQKQQRLNELDQAFAAEETNIRERRTELKQLTEKVGPSIDVEMMQNYIKNLDLMLAEIFKEKERLIVEMRARARVTLMWLPDAPESKD